MVHDGEYDVCLAQGTSVVAFPAFRWSGMK